MAGNAREPGRSVSSRLLSVLGAFDPDHRHLALSDIARRADVPLTTAHRLIAELENWQALNRRDDGRYEIGRRIWDLGLLAAVQRDLREVALPYLQDVHAATGETVQIAIREKTRALYVERVAGRTSAQVISRTGTMLPLHATAVGKVLMAYAPPEVVLQATNRPRRVTPYTIVEPGRLLRELAETRRRGYSRTAQEMTYGAYSVAVPVCADSGQVVAALGVVVDNPRRDLTRLVPGLQVAAHGIGRSLPSGWVPR
jgi:DNA-binding IclR family transcriptional regulator